VHPVTKRELLIGLAMLVAMLGCLTYGYFLLKKDEPVNCWDQYATENEAILNCEVHDQ
jgi:hypothetical protein